MVVVIFFVFHGVAVRAKHFKITQFVVRSVAVLVMNFNSCGTLAERASLAFSTKCPNGDGSMRAFPFSIRLIGLDLFESSNTLRQIFVRSTAKSKSAL